MTTSCFIGAPMKVGGEEEPGKEALVAQPTEAPPTVAPLEEECGGDDAGEQLSQEQLEEEQRRQQQQHRRILQQMIQRQPPQIFGYVDPLWNPQHRHGQHNYDYGDYGYHPLPIQHAAASHHHHHHHHRAFTMDGVPLPPGIPGLGGSTDPLEAVLGPFPCVKLRNLPFDATLEDILVLFQGLVVLDVLIVGQGEAFVIFANPMDYQMALQRDRQTIGRRYVDIVQGSRADYYEAIATQHIKEQRPQQSLAGEGGGRRGDQPTTSNTQQISSDSSAMWGSSAPGLGFFQHQQQRDKGEQHQGGADPMGGRGPIGIVPGLGMGSGGVGGPERGLGSSAMSSVGGGGGRSAQGPPNVKRTGGGIQVGEHTGFLRMRGLPFSSTKDDIFKFFEGYNPVQESIVLTYRSDGRATGEAYVGFISPDDSKKAMDLHRKSMGTRYIELFISNKDEHGRALQRFGNR